MSDFSTAYPSTQDAAVREVPMREIALDGGEPPLRVYDTSGPQNHDVSRGLPKLREGWVAPRRARANG